MKLSIADREVLNDFGYRLKSVLMQLSVSQKELAENIGVSPNTVSLWVKGKRDISLTYLYRIIDYFHDSFPYCNVVWELCPDFVVNEQNNLTKIQRKNIINRLSSLPDDLRCEIASKCDIQQWDDLFDDSLIASVKKILGDY